MNMFDYFNDGAGPQAQAVLAYLGMNDGVENSWDKEQGEYLAAPIAYRWHNCREQGYVICMRSKGSLKQINIAFFEHRNSDSICAIEWEQVTVYGNPPTIDNAQFGEIYKDKYDTSKDFAYGEAAKMADWIIDRLSDFWGKNA